MWWNPSRSLGARGISSDSHDRQVLVDTTLYQ